MLIYWMRNQIVILAAGKGTRLGTSSVPKVLVMLKNKPLIFYLLDQIEHISQLIKPVVVIGYMADKVRGVLGEDFFYAMQEQQLGTAHAVKAAKGKIKAKNILVLYGDMPFIKAESLKSLMKLHHKKDSNISIMTTIVSSFEEEYKSLKHYGRIIRNPSPFSPSKGGGKGGIIKITEYKDASDKEKEIKELNTGIYMFQTEWLWENIKKIKNRNAQKEYYLTDIVEVAISENEAVNSLEIDPREVMGINSLEDLRQAEKII